MNRGGERMATEETLLLHIWHSPPNISQREAHCGKGTCPGNSQTVTQIASENKIDVYVPIRFVNIIFFTESIQLEILSCTDSNVNWYICVEESREKNRNLQVCVYIKNISHKYRIYFLCKLFIKLKLFINH